MEQLTRFFQLPFRMKRLLAEAWLELGLMRLLLLLFSFRRLASRLGRSDPDRAPALDPDQEEQGQRIGWAVRTAGRRTPWHSTCLVQALAAKRMLRRRGLPGILHFGIAKDAPHQLRAHAWLQCGRHIITGKSEMQAFKEISSFS